MKSGIMSFTDADLFKKPINKRIKMIFEPLTIAKDFGGFLTLCLFGSGLRRGISRFMAASKAGGHRMKKVHRARVVPTRGGSAKHDGAGLIQDDLPWFFSRIRCL